MTSVDRRFVKRIINKKNKKGGVDVSLNIVPADVLGYIGDVFSPLWPIIAIGLGIMAVPMIIGAAKTAFGRRR